MVGSPWKKAEVLEEYVQHSPLRDNILFTGFVASEQMPEAYRSASLYVFPSCFEGFGLSLVEAMHYGCPCCCSDNSSLGEIGKDAALLFPPDDIDAIRDAMQRILENRDGIREQLIAAGHARAAQFDWDCHAAEIIRLYEDAIGKGEATR
jgi:glycosyltransferase involved in cell wall biosynthesis